MFRNLFYKIQGYYTHYWWLTPLTVFIIWRIIIEIFGQFAFSLQPDVIIPWKNNPNPPLWARWDSGWYNSILNYGYKLSGTDQMSNVTFFPLFPLLWKIVEIITPLKGFNAALFVSNTFTLLGFLVFYRWVYEKWNKPIALKSLVALAVFPTSFFLISAYSEAVLFLLIASTLFLTYRKKWFLAAIVIGLASAARPTGILLWPLLIWFWWSNNSNKPKPFKELIYISCLPPLGLILFSIHLYFKTGNPLVWLSGQSAAGRNLVLPINLLWAYTKNILIGGDNWLKHLAEMMALFFTIFLIPQLKKIHPAYALYAFLNLLPSLFSNTLTSIQRFVLIIIPLFAIVALQKKWVYVIYCTLGIILLFYSISRFVIFQWAG